MRLYVKSERAEVKREPAEKIGPKTALAEKIEPNMELAEVKSEDDTCRVRGGLANLCDLCDGSFYRRSLHLASRGSRADILWHSTGKPLPGEAAADTHVVSPSA